MSGTLTKLRAPKKCSYYVWFLGARESRGLRGSEFVEEVVKDLLGTDNSEHNKVTLHVSSKGLKIVHHIGAHELGKKRPETVKHFIPDHAVSYACQTESASDVVSCILLIFNPATQCPVHVHSYRCDSQETAAQLQSSLAEMAARNCARVSSLEQRLVSRGLLALHETEGHQHHHHRQQQQQQQQTPPPMPRALIHELRQRIDSRNKPLRESRTPSQDSSGIGSDEPALRNSTDSPLNPADFQRATNPLDFNEDETSAIGRTCGGPRSTPLLSWKHTDQSVCAVSPKPSRRYNCHEYTAGHRYEDHHHQIGADNVGRSGIKKPLNYRQYSEGSANVPVFTPEEHCKKVPCAQEDDHINHSGECVTHFTSFPHHEQTKWESIDSRAERSLDFNKSRKYIRSPYVSDSVNPAISPPSYDDQKAFDKVSMWIWSTKEYNGRQSHTQQNSHPANNVPLEYSIAETRTKVNPLWLRTVSQDNLPTTLQPKSTRVQRQKSMSNLPRNSLAGYLDPDQRGGRVPGLDRPLGRSISSDRHKTNGFDHTNFANREQRHRLPVNCGDSKRNSREESLREHSSMKMSPASNGNNKDHSSHSITRHNSFSYVPDSRNSLGRQEIPVRHLQSRRTKKNHYVCDTGQQQTITNIRGKSKATLEKIHRSERPLEAAAKERSLSAKVPTGSHGSKQYRTLLYGQFH